MAYQYPNQQPQYGAPQQPYQAAPQQGYLPANNLMPPANGYAQPQQQYNNPNNPQSSYAQPVPQPLAQPSYAAAPAPASAMGGYAQPAQMQYPSQTPAQPQYNTMNNHHNPLPAGGMAPAQPQQPPSTFAAPQFPNQNTVAPVYSTPKPSLPPPPMPGMQMPAPNANMNTMHNPQFPNQNTQQPNYGLPQPQQNSYPPPQQPQGPGANNVTNQFNNMSMNTQSQHSQPPQMPQLSNVNQQYQQPRYSPPKYITPVHAKYMSACVNSFPNSNSLRLRSNLLFGCVLRPLANPPSGSPALPTINFKTTGVQRCDNCRAYINPYVQFLDGGNRWRCCLCGRSNDCKKDYFSPTDLQGVRTDIQERPELTHASVEIIAPEQYTVRPPMPPVYVFVIDISIASIQSGMLETLCTAARAALDTLPGGKRTRVAVITFDSSVYYYSCKAGQTAPKMFVMPDLDDIFLPQASDLLVNLDECREQMEYLFETLPSMHAKTQDVESAVGPALEASMKLMAPLGGKLMLFVSGIPSIGIGRLKNRENARLIGTEQEKKMLIPATDFYKKTAIKFTKYQIGVDLYMFSHSYTDVATLSQLPKLTGGQVYYYPSFTSKKLGAKFSAELTRNLTRSTGFEAVLRVRASTGVEICGYHGNFFLRGSDLLALPHVDADKAFAVELRNNETVISTSTIVVQAALLYTSTRGERRIRVHTQCLPVTQNLLDLYNNANVNAITNVMAKQAINIALNNNFHKAREFIQSKCTNIVRGYRNSLRNSGMNQKPSLSVIGTLPLMTLGLLKNAAFKEGVDVRPDVRSNVLASIFTMGVVECETFIRPRMLPLHTMTEKEGLVDEKGGVTMPQEVGLSMDQLKSDGCYLIDNGFQFVVRVGRKVDPSFAKLVLGVDSLEAANMREVRLRQPEDDGVRTSDCHRIHNILNYLRKVSSHHQDVVIVREGDSNEVYFFNFLIEDRGTGGRSMSLAEFTNHIQRNSGYN